MLVEGKKQLILSSFTAFADYQNLQTLIGCNARVARNGFMSNFVSQFQKTVCTVKNHGIVLIVDLMIY